MVFKFFLIVLVLYLFWRFYLRPKTSKARNPAKSRLHRCPTCGLHYPAEEQHRCGQLAKPASQAEKEQ